MRPVIFGPAERPLLGFWHEHAHARDGASTRGLAVVLCNPLGYEGMSVHRTYRHLAERLAHRGFFALRFDYDGTGNSAGRSDDPGRVRAWLDSIKAAVDEARSLSGVHQVALFGIRFGATLAAQAAAEQGDIECLIQWAPIVSGRVYTRELRALRMLNATKIPAPQPVDGGEDVAGYFLSSETLADLSALDLLSTANPGARRALVLPRNERAFDETRLVEHLNARGTDARLCQDASYGRMMRDDPYETVVPIATLDVIADWLCEVRYSDGRAVGATTPARHALALPARRDEVGVVETPLLFGRRDDQRLFGVLTEPSVPVHADRRPVLLFLNVGANHHVGPHRMNVDFARHFASLGYLSFRFDVAGLGESPASPGTSENRIYTRDSIADVQSAMTLLGERRNAKRFVLIGLCSGAYLAFHTTVEDKRVASQILLSSYAFEWQEGDSVTPTERKPYNSTRSYARALFDHRVWVRALRGEVNIHGITRILVERLQTQVAAELPYLMARLRGQSAPRNDIERAFHAICDRGIPSLLLFSFNDGGLDMIARYLGNDARRMRGRKEFVLEIADGTDHTFTSLESQRMLSEALTGYVTRHFP
jgi:alpha-beta hydrolase superfamily lysophospholipase